MMPREKENNVEIPLIRGVWWAIHKERKERETERRLRPESGPHEERENFVIKSWE